MWHLEWIVLVLASFGFTKHSVRGATSAPATGSGINARNFQINFLIELEKLFDKAAEKYLNESLEQFKSNEKYEQHAAELEAAVSSDAMEQKIVSIKQMLDIKKNMLENAAVHSNDLYALRNVNFLKKMQQHLQELRYDKAQEMQQLRMYELCRQFRVENELQEKQKAELRPYSRAIKLVPLDEEHVADILHELEAHQNRTISIDIAEFGRNLYERVKVSGAEIIDNYLSTIRLLLHEVMLERPTQERMHSSKLQKVMSEIDHIISTADLYEKRRRLYDYLESNLAADYEQFQSTQHAQQDLAEIFMRFKRQGIDLFVTFLFSNFEFLERLHEEWLHLLPQAPRIFYDAMALQLHDIPTLYLEFKKDTEQHGRKYEAYLEQVKALQQRTVSASHMQDVKIFELLHNASLNVGSVTLNMIRAKCVEIS